MNPFSSLRTLLVASLLGGLASLSASCGSDAPPIGNAVVGRDSLPVMVSRGISKLISDSGIIRYKFIAEEWRVFDKTQPPRWEFPKGIFIERYDDKFKVNLHITADSAWLYDQNLWKLHGHVELHDQAAQTHLQTQELFWNMRTGQLWSDVYTRLIEPQQEIEGDWFRATVINKRLTRYHVRRSRGFMPMGNLGASEAAPAPLPGVPADTLPADTLPKRDAPVSHRKSGANPSLR